jgi:hypothetical protein
MKMKGGKKMRIIDIECIPEDIKWIIKYIQENLLQTPEDFKIYGDGNQILFSVSLAKMQFEFLLKIEKRSFLIRGFWSSKEKFITDEKKYFLSRRGLRNAFKEIVDLMKAEVNKYLDSILKKSNK